MFKVGYNEFDVSLPVVKRVQYFVRKIREVIAPGSGASPTTVPEVASAPATMAKKAVEVDDSTLPSAEAAHEEKTNDFVRELLKSGWFFSSDEQKLATGSSAFGDTASTLSVPTSSAAETSRKTRKKTESVDMDVDFAVTPSTSDTSFELSSPVTRIDEVKRKMPKAKIDVSDLFIDSTSVAESNGAVSEASPITEAKTRSRQKKTKSTLSDGISQLS